MLRLIRKHPFICLFVLVLALLYFAANIATFYTDWLWFGSVGYRRTFIRIYGTRIVLFSVFGLASFLLAYVNVVLARRWSPPVDVHPPGTQTALYIPGNDQPVGRFLRFFSQFRTILDGLLLVGAVVFAVLAGYAAQSQWDIFLRFLHPEPFGTLDPMFGRDIGLYVFTLPFVRYVQGWLLVVLMLVGGGVTLVYVYQQSINAVAGRANIPPHVRSHLSAIASLALLAKAWGYSLDRFDLMFNGDLFPGAGYTDVHARLPMLFLLCGITVLVAIAVGANIWRRTLALPAVALTLWVLCAVVGVVIPGFVQRIEVKPNEIEREMPYLYRALHGTRAAYGLEHIRTIVLSSTARLTGSEVKQNQITLENIRLWDKEPFRAALLQQQQFRPYYQFTDVNADRYRLSDGTYHQVMIAMRDIAPSQLEPRAQTWQNSHLRYTHGFGAVVNASGQTTTEGLPAYLLKDIPPTAVDSTLALREPRLYFSAGYEADSYVLVNGAQREFDFPSRSADDAPEDQENRYTGAASGVRLTFPAKLACAIRFNGWATLLLSDAVTPQTRILFFRRVAERVKHIAPFLMMDHDPYPVIVEGKLYWIQDCLTVSGAYPYSEAIDWVDDLSVPVRLNYARNSVKAVVSAYDGSVALFAADPSDPILRSYQRAFPDLIRKLDEMSPALRAHLRYSKDLLRIQRRLLSEYHVDDPGVFYARTDAWDVPRRIPPPTKASDSRIPIVSRDEDMEPNFTTVRLPGMDVRHEEFTLLSPFTLRGRPGLSALLAARCDPPFLGELVLFRVPEGSTVFGPEQVERRILSDSKVSAYLARNEPQDSLVQLGALRLIPVGQSLLYVQPIYLKGAPEAASDLSTASSMTALKQVVVVYGSRIIMEPTLSGALADLFGDASGASLSNPAESGTITENIQQADEQYQRAQECLRRGDFAGYGRAMQSLGEVLRRLRVQSGKARAVETGVKAGKIPQ